MNLFISVVQVVQCQTEILFYNFTSKIDIEYLYT